MTVIAKKNITTGKMVHNKGKGQEVTTLGRTVYESSNGIYVKEMRREKLKN